MNVAERAAWIEAAHKVGERQRREQQALEHARGLELAVKQLIAEDVKQRQSEVNARRLAEWAQSLPQPLAKYKPMSQLDYMSTAG